MLTKTLAKIDRYYPILVLVVLGLTILIIFTLRGVFTALNTASEFDPELGSSSLKIEKATLEEVYEQIRNRNVPSLTGTP